MAYHSPTEDILFLLDHVVGFEAVLAAQGGLDRETVAAVLGEAASLVDAKIAPLQRPGDLAPARLENGTVLTSPGFHDGYRAYAGGGWIGISAPEQYGGMQLPRTLSVAVNDMFSGACLSLGLNPVLTQGQILALCTHASEEIKALYLPKLISGEWAGVMDLTEAQAGSDVGALRTKAEPLGDGTYKITGQKIYISWGDSDLTENICHLVLARLADAPPGTRGITLFLVPKFLPNPDGSLGNRNDLRVVSLEHKLGLHGSPTAVMEFSGAIGWRIGAENGGMAAMFTMMNDARLNVAVQGIGVAE
ncbi:MAG: acyl-CoA dehydrogenase family protein, partial [Pseudomonadota bacterium]